MKSRLFSSILAILLMVSLIAPPALLIAPRTTYAEGGVPTDDFFVQIKETLNLIETYVNTAANVAQKINTYVLQPAAFIMSGNLLKLLTSSVLDFIVNGGGTGAPMFVQDVNSMMQRVGDIQANAFFLQFGRNSNSPFASSISSALQANYFRNTSSAGFWAANRSTLPGTRQSQNAFLSGNWSQGGTRSWFALTTQTQNNPYMLYQASQSQLASVVASAQAARQSVLDWGQGFMSWCSANEEGTPMSDEEFPVGGGTSPGDPCTNSDGTPGTMQTPGSTIKATLDKVLGGTQDKLVQMGSVAKEINGILGQVGNIASSVGSVIGTVQFASSILGGSSGGIIRASQSSGINRNSRVFSYQSEPGFLGVTQSTVVQNAATLTSNSDTSSRLDQYESSWNTIRSSAMSASTTLDNLASFCRTAADDAANSIRIDNLSYYENVSPSASRGITPAFVDASRAQASTSQEAILTKIIPVITQANTASATIATTRAFVRRMRDSSDANSATTSSQYLNDLQTLQSMPPSDQDISNAMENAISTMGGAVAIPSGSLNVSGGSIVGRMTLLGTNAEALKTSVCTPHPPRESGSSGDGGGGG